MLESKLTHGVALALLLVGCASDKPAIEPPVLSDPSKADDGGLEIVPIGALAYGGEVRGEFIRDDQYEGYTFEAEADAIITLDNTHLGSSARLDSTLYIYGPRDENGFYGADPIAFDDDGGWGLHGRIRDFRIEQTGQYMAVLSTYIGLDRGRYRLTLTCESERCEPPVSPGIVQTVTDLDVGEDGTSRTFNVHLTVEPTQGVEVWIESSDLYEAVVHPARVFFCAVDTHLSNRGCVPDTGDEEPTDEVHWQRTVEVRVTGVRDDLADGDAPFEVNFRVISADPNYAEVTPAALQGTNADNSVSPDYSELDGLVDDELIAGLYARIADHEVYGYQGVNSARTLLFGTVDVRDGQVESLYTGQVIDAPGESILAFMRGFNTEHSWPQAQFDRLDPMVSDLHHIFAVDRDSNSLRSSYGFGYNDIESASSRLGTSSTDGRGLVYQVRPERRGDIARAHFYMVARYALDATTGIDFDDDSIESNGRIEDGEEAVLRMWNVEDPVDEWERQRNERVEAFQGNRNPFIDMPELADRITNF